MDDALHLDSDTQAGHATLAGSSSGDLSLLAPMRAGMPDMEAEQLLNVQELERQRIAVELHDALGPLLTLIRLELGHAAELALGDGSGALAPVIGRANHHVAQAFDELRRTVINLRPAMLDDLGILPTLGWLVREFETSGCGLRILTDLTVSEQVVPAHLKITIFRICQEALTNVIKHAQATQAVLSLTCVDGWLCLAVDDDGCGMPDSTHPLRRPAGGTAGIRWRAASSGGRCEITSGPGLGTRIHVRWLLPSSRS